MGALPPGRVLVPDSPRSGCRPDRVCSGRRSHIAEQPGPFLVPVARARVTVRRSGGAVRFEVRDDGRGFDPGAYQPGRGLRNLRERVERLGGAMLVSSAPGAGTTVAGRVPIDQRFCSAT